MNNWNIQSRAHACQVCEKSFADKEKYHTVLTDAKSDYTRLDLCVTCWESQYEDGANERKGFISHWQGVYEAAPEAPPEPIQKASAETLNQLDEVQHQVARLLEHGLTPSPDQLPAIVIEVVESSDAEEVLEADAGTAPEEDAEREPA